MIITLQQWHQRQDPRFWVASLLIGLWLLVPPFALSVGGGLASKEHLVRLLPFLIVLAMRPKWLRARFSWFDLPVLLYCACPFISGVANGLGLRFSFWQTVLECSYWLVPYWLGRAVFTAGWEGESSQGAEVGSYRMVRGRNVGPVTVDHSRALATVIVLGALVYLLPTLFEVFRGPVLTAWATGEARVGQLRGAARGLTFKPSVFLASGFVLTMFLVLASLIAACRASVLRVAIQDQRASGGGAALVWIVTAAAMAMVVLGCRSLGSIALLATGLAIVVLIRCLPTASMRWTLPVALGGLLLLPPLYMAARVTGMASTERISSGVELVASHTRAGSFEYRLKAEDAVFQRMTGHWWLGHGHFGRWGDDKRLLDAADRSTPLPTKALDGFWLFTLTRTGWLSVAAWWAMVAVPVFVYLLRWPRRFTEGRRTPGSIAGNQGLPGDTIAFSLFLGLSLIDSMVNYFGALPQMLLVGSMTGLIVSGERRTSGLLSRSLRGFRFPRQWLYAVYLAMSLLLPIAAFGPRAADSTYFAEVVGTALPSGEFINRSTVAGLFAWIVAAIIVFATRPTVGTFRFAKVREHAAFAERKSIQVDRGALQGAWRHVPIMVWVACPLLTGLLNPSSLVAASVQSLYLLLAWGGPYAMGCVLLGNLNRLRFSAQVILSAGFLSFVVCMLEFFWGRFLYESLYGHHPYVLEGRTRYFGWRPLMMFEDPNQLGMWFATLSITAVAWFRFSAVGGGQSVLWGWLTPAATRVLLAVNAWGVFWFQAIGASVLAVLGAISISWCRRPKGRWSRRLESRWVLAAVFGLVIVLFALRGPILHYGRATLKTTTAGRQVTSVMKDFSMGSLTWRLAREDDYHRLIGQHPIVGWGTVDFWRQKPDLVRPWGLVTLVAGAYGALGVLAWLSMPVGMICTFWWLPGGRVDGAWPLRWVVVLAVIHTMDAFLNSAYLLAILPLYGGANMAFSRCIEDPVE